MTSIRALREADWPDVLRCADEALPHAGLRNQAWLDNRRLFDQGVRRRHYVVEVGNEVIGYGAIEEEKDARWRLFVVMSPVRLNSAVGDDVAARLLADASELGAGTLWLREEAGDRAMATFCARHGFAEVQRFTVEDVAISVYERSLIRC
jgi:N-acetylglutamate synthase-like GNAT family acetyltransferase